MKAPRKHCPNSMVMVLIPCLRGGHVVGVGGGGSKPSSTVSSRVVL